MRDLKKLNAKQRFLQKNIRRNMLIQRLRETMGEAQSMELSSEAKLIGKMVKYLEGSNDHYDELKRSFRLRKLDIV